MAKGKAPERQPQLVDHVADSSDEEIDEDVAFNSDDERKYGALFNSVKDGSSDEDDDDKDNDDDNDDEGSEKSYDEDSDGIASDDEAEGGDAGQYMLDLLNNLDKKDDNTKQAKKDARKTLAHSKLIQESEFSTVVKGSALTMDQLMGGIVDTKGFGNVKKAMKDMTPNLYDDEKRISTTKTPVAKVVSDRAQRKVAYAENVEEVGQWTTVTKRNREAETLDFRPKDRVKISKDELVGKFEATTDFEKEMAAALEEAGATDEKDMMKNQEEGFFGDDDDDDLGRSNLSIEEYRKRRGELSKMRALMFYEEQKRHHMSKIKSKKYRKIRKKQRTRLQDSEDAEAAEQDEDYARELEEKAEMERMKERMSLKHRNTSKWAKRVLRRGANVDKDTRKALSEQVRIGDELKKKMQGHFSDSEDEDGDGNLLEQARTLLTETEKNDDDEKKKGLFELAFMKKGLEAQRERAKQEARELLKELEANGGSGSDADQGALEEEEEESERQKKRKKIASSSEMEKILPKGKLIAKSLEFGNSNAVSITGAIDLDMEENPVKSKLSAPGNATDVELTSVDVDSMKDAESGRVFREDAIASENSQKPTAVEEESNPWMQSPSDKKKPLQEGRAPSSNKRKKSLPSVSKQGVINVADVTDVLSGGVEKEEQENSDSATDTKKDDKVQSKQKIASLSQDELVRQAFATVSDKDIEDEFESEKEAMRGRDDHSKKKKEDDKKLSGWGSWAGEGAPAPRPPKKLPKRLQAPEKKAPKRRRKDDGKKNVIINAKRMKKTAKFQIENIPHPYSSRVQYERAMAGGMGSEWNVSGATKNMTRPEILTRAGKIIRPISKKSKVKRAPAKFN